MSDKLAVLQTEESIRQIRKLIQETRPLVHLFRDVSKEANNFNKMLRSGNLREQATAMQNLVNITRQYAAVQRELTNVNQRLSNAQRTATNVEYENARAREAAARATREESLARQQLAREQRAGERATNDDTSAHRRLTREVREARQRARDYGAEIIALKQRYREGGISSREYRDRLNELNRNFRTSTNEAIRLERQLRSLNQSTLPSGQRNGSLQGRVTDIIKGLGVFTLLQKSISAVTNAAMKMGVEFFNTAVKLETLRFSQMAVFKTQEEVKAQNVFLTAIAERYGLEILSLTDAYTKFSASAQGTTLEGEKSKQIFDAVAKSSAMLGVSTEDTNGILRALGQMMSKGKVQAEELRGQLGDRMAGAFRLFADGMGVSTAALDKMLKDGKVITEDVLPKFADQLNKKYELGLGEEIDTKQANIARLKNEWVDFVDAVESRTGIVSAGIGAISNGIVTLLQALKPSKEVTAIEQQQQRLNELAIQLRQTWKDENKRKEVLDEIIALNPMLLRGMDLEKTSLEEITKRLQEANLQYYQRIILQEKQEEITELVKDQAKNFKDLANILSENAVAYNSFNKETKDALDSFSAGSLKYEEAEIRIISSTRAGSDERRKAISILKDMNKIYTNGKMDGFNYVRGINDGNKAIREQTGEYNNLLNVTNRWLGVQGQLISFNGLLAKSYKSSGEAVRNRRKEIEEELKMAEGRGDKFALVSNVWRARDKNGKWSTTTKKQTDGWYMENGNLVKRKPATLPEKEKKPKAASLTAAEKDFVNKATGIRDAEIASLKQRKLDLLISQEEYWKEYEQIYQRFNSKIQNYIKGANAKQIQVEGSVYRKAIEAREQATKEIYDLQSKNLEEQNKKEVDLLERHSKDIEKADFYTDVEKIQKQIDIDSQLIDQANIYYAEQIELARKSAQSTIEWERKRDEEIGKLQDARADKFRSRIDALQKDLERETAISDSQVDISLGEQKRLIMSDKKLSNDEKAYRISLAEIDAQIRKNNNKIKELQVEKARYDLMIAMSELEGKDNPEAKKNSAVLGAQISNLETDNVDLNNQGKDLISEKTKAIREIIINGFADIGFSRLSDAYAATMEELKNKTAEWKDYAVLAAAAVADSLSNLSQRQKERTIANLDEQLKVSQENTDLEIGFINNRLEAYSNMDELTKEQMEDRNRLEDQARTFREQQQQREKLIATQKAKAEQKAAAQQALINGALAATQTLAQLGFAAGAIPAALALAFGIAQSIAISSKNPIPQYWKGTMNAKEGLAWRDEKGAEIHTDKNDNIKSLGDNSGAKLVHMEAGDKVYTATQTKDYLRKMKELKQVPKVGGKFFKNAALNYLQAPIVNVTVAKPEDNSDKIAKKVGEEVARQLGRFNNPTQTRENGIIFKYKGAQIREITGYYDVVTGKEISKDEYLKKLQ